MRERLVCALIGCNAGSVGGFFAHVGLDYGDPRALVVVLSLLIALVVGAMFALVVGLTRTERLLPGLALMGAILGFFAGVAAFLVVWLVPLAWFLTAPLAGLVVGFFLCGACAPEPRHVSIHGGVV